MLTYGNIPDVNTLVERASSEILAVGREGHRVDGLSVPAEDMQTLATLDVPQAYGRVEARTG